jgi:multidrug efflux pump subunit AcrA (membrane-fusion protein)
MTINTLGIARTTGSPRMAGIFQTVGTIGKLPAIVCLLAAAFVAGCAKKEEKPEEEKAAAVHAKKAELRTIKETVEGLGFCEPLPDENALLTSAVEGRVLEILVKPGQSVKAGEAIVQLDPTIAKANLDKEQATVDGLEASLRLLKSLPRPEEQESFKQAIETAKISQQKTEATAERLRPLLARGEISAQQMYEAELAVKQAQLAEQTAESQFKVAMLGPRPEAVEEAKGKIIVEQAALAAARATLDQHTLRAPIDGVVNSISCRLGQTLAVGATVGEIVDFREVYASIWLPSADAKKVCVSQDAEVTVTSVKEAGEEEAEAVEGKVAFIGPMVDPQSGNVPVKVLVQNGEGILGLGQTVSVEIIINEKEKALAVPIDAVENVGEGAVLAVIRDDKVKLLHPQIGVKDKEWLEVQGTDLKEGEQVVTVGGYNLEDGAKVEVLPEESKEEDE